MRLRTSQLGVLSAKDGGIILPKHRQSEGTETAPAPNLSTEQSGRSDTLIKSILKQEEEDQETEQEATNQEPPGHTPQRCSILG